MKLSLSLGALAALQLASSFLLQLIVLSLLGAGSQTDAWVAAQAVPLVVFSVLSVALQGAWQSRLATATEQQLWLSTQKTAQGQLLLVFGGALLVLGGTAELWVRWLFPGFSEAQATIAVRMTRILLVGTLLNGQAALLTTALRARERFVGPEAVALGGSVGAILLAALTVPRFGIEAAAWVSLARSVCVCAILFWLAHRPAPSLVAAWHDHEGWKQSRPILIGSAFYKTGPLVDRFWSSLAPTGGMTLFNLVQTGMGALAMVLERSLCTPVTPQLARLAEGRDFATMRRLYRRSIARVSVAAGAALVALLALYPAWPHLAGPLLKLDAAASTTAWWLCVVLLGYLHPAAAGSVVVSSFYALGDSHTPVRVGIIGFTVSLALKAAGFLLAGLMGLALATAMHYMGNMLVMCWMLERRLNGLSSQH